MLSVLAVVAPTLGLVPIGCQKVQTEYEPRTVLQPSAPEAFRAARFFDQDIPLIYRAGGRIIGNLHARGSVASSFEDVDDEALLEAARLGGTHLIRTRKDVHQIFVRLSQAQASTDCSEHGDIDVLPGRSSATYSGASHCQTTYSDPSYMTLEVPEAQYVVIAVPCENWVNLPEALRPVSYDPCVPTAEPEPEGALPEPAREIPAGATTIVDDTCAVEPSRRGRPFFRPALERAMRAGVERSLSCGWGERAASVVLTFGPAGCLREARIAGLDQGGEDEALAHCLLRAFSRAKVTPFSGEAVTVRKTLGRR